MALGYNWTTVSKEEYYEWLGKTTNHLHMRIQAILISQNQSANTSKIKIRGQLNINTYGNFDTCVAKLECNGKSKSNDAFHVYLNTDWQTICTSDEIEISHDDNGNCTVSCSYKQSGYQMATKTIYASFALPQILREAKLRIDSATADLENAYVNYTCTSGDFYHIQYRLNGGAWIGSSGNPQIRIGGLSAGTQYKIEVRGLNRDSTIVGPASNAVWVTTKNINVRIDSVSTDMQNAYIKYTRLNISPNYIEYRLNGGSWRIASSTSSPIKITGLSPGTTYRFEIRGLNSSKSVKGPASNAVSATTTHIIVRIDSASTDLENAYVNYTPLSGDFALIQYRLNDGNWLYNAGYLRTTIEGLKPNTKYKIELRGANRDKTIFGPPSNSVTVTTKDIGKISSISNFNLGSNVTINITNPTSTSLVLNVYDSKGNLILTRSGFNSAYTLNYTESEIEKLNELIGENESAKLRFEINTLSKYGNSKEASVILSANFKHSSVKVNNQVKDCMFYIKYKGKVVPVLPYILENGTVKRAR